MGKERENHSTSRAAEGDLGGDVSRVKASRCGFSATSGGTAIIRPEWPLVIRGFLFENKFLEINDGNLRKGVNKS